MAGFLGEIACKLDTKHRLTMPTKFVRQLPPENNDRLILNCGIEKCLTLYTVPEWEKVTIELQSLNRYDAKHRLFLRRFFRGATQIVLDNNNRFLIPKRLMEYAGLDKNIVLLGYFNVIEIWSAETFDTATDIAPNEFADLASVIMNQSLTSSPLTITNK